MCRLSEMQVEDLVLGGNRAILGVCARMTLETGSTDISIEALEALSLKFERLLCLYYREELGKN